MTAALQLQRRSCAAIRADIRRWSATVRRHRWQGLYDEAAEARLLQLQAELWSSWRLRS